MNSLKRFADPVYCIMRLIVGVMFACHGAQKVFGVLGAKGIAGGGMYVFGWFELTCGILVALGLLTHIGALLGSGIMAIAYFKAHAPGGFFPIINHGELAVVYCWLFLFMFFYGGGSLSLDSLIFRRGATTAGGV